MFEELGCTVEWLLPEGADIVPVCEVARVTGPVRMLLMGERTALNIITRACGVATQVHVVPPRTTWDVIGRAKRMRYC